MATYILDYDYSASHTLATYILDYDYSASHTLTTPIFWTMTTLLTYTLTEDEGNAVGKPFVPIVASCYPFLKRWGGLPP